jgi:hypothetical protein
MTTRKLEPHFVQVPIETAKKILKKEMQKAAAKAGASPGLPKGREGRKS